MLKKYHFQQNKNFGGKILLMYKCFGSCTVFQTLTGLERILINCSEHLSQEEQAEYPPPPVEHYYDQGMVGE